MDATGDFRALGAGSFIAYQLGETEIAEGLQRRLLEVVALTPPGPSLEYAVPAMLLARAAQRAASAPDSVLILVEAPGLAASDLKVEVRGTLVSISGVKPAGLPRSPRLRFHCLERGHGRFLREIHVIAPVNTHQGTARLADGLLTIELPKIEDKRMTARVLPVVGEPEDEAR